MVRARHPPISTDAVVLSRPPEPEMQLWDNERIEEGFEASDSLKKPCTGPLTQNLTTELNGSSRKRLIAKKKKKKKIKIK